MTPRQLATEVENAFDARDRATLIRFLAKLTAAAAPPAPAALTREQLHQRRDDLHVQLACVNAELQRHERLRSGMLPTPPSLPPPESLEPSS
jgi:hypothetical protein